MEQRVNLTPDEKQVSLAKDKPVAYMLVVAIAIASIFIFMYFKATSSIRSDCLEQVNDLRAENKELRNIVIKLSADFKKAASNTDSLVLETIHNNKNVKP